MRRLSRKVRVERAVHEAEAHVRKWGTADLDDWAFTYAVNWGFEEDKAIIETITQAMKATDQTVYAEKEAERQKQLERRKAQLPKPWTS